MLSSINQTQEATMKLYKIYSILLLSLISLVNGECPTPCGFAPLNSVAPQAKSALQTATAKPNAQLQHHLVNLGLGQYGQTSVSRRSSRQRALYMLHTSLPQTAHQAPLVVLVPAARHVSARPDGSPARLRWAVVVARLDMFADQLRVNHLGYHPSDPPALRPPAPG
jgi:hypothetical protein